MSMSVPGLSRPMRSVPVPINVRCYSNSDIIVRRSQTVTRWPCASHERSDKSSIHVSRGPIHREWISGNPLKSTTQRRCDFGDWNTKNTMIQRGR